MEIYAGLIEFNWTLLFIWLTFVVLYLIMKKFFFEKVHDFMEARATRIKESFENAEQINLVANQKLDLYEEKIAGVEAEGREIVRQAKLRAEEQSHEIQRAANERASLMIRQAEVEIERRRLRAVQDMQQEIADLALLAAGRILEKELDPEGQEEIIAGLLSEAGRDQWKM